MPSVEEPSSTEEPSSKPPAFESWGRYPSYDATLKPLHWQGDFPAALAGVHSGALAVGMGRSYGDVCLLNHGTLMPTTSMDRLLAFDAATGLLTAEAGITLAQILDFAGSIRKMRPSPGIFPARFMLARSPN